MDLNTKFSPNFTFGELTNTNNSKLLDLNRQKALEYPNVGKLYVLANTLLQPIREAWGSGIKINSAYRCPELNTAVGGSTSSQHMLAEAADLDVGDLATNKKLFDLIVSLGKKGAIRFGQVILEGPAGSAWVHVSLGRPFRDVEGQVMTYMNNKYTVLETINWSK